MARETKKLLIIKRKTGIYDIFQKVESLTEESNKWEWVISRTSDSNLLEELASFGTISINFYDEQVWGKFCLRKYV